MSNKKCKKISKIAVFGEKYVSESCIIVAERRGSGPQLQYIRQPVRTLVLCMATRNEKGGLRFLRKNGKMANKPIEALIKCPFYLQIREDGIACEGYIGGTCMITKFRSQEQKKAHLKANCFQPDGGDCFMAKSLFEKYENEA